MGREDAVSPGTPEGVKKQKKLHAPVLLGTERGGRAAKCQEANKQSRGKIGGRYELFMPFRTVIFLLSPAQLAE